MMGMTRKHDTDFPEEEFDWQIRWALHSQLDGEDPSPDVWERIRTRIERPSRDETLRPPWSLKRNGFTPLVQAAVLAIVIASVGLNFGLSGYLNAHPSQPPARPPAPAASERESSGIPRYPEDFLTLRLLYEQAREADHNIQHISP